MNYGFCRRAKVAIRFEMRHYVVADLAFVFGNFIVIDVVYMSFHFGDLLVGNIKPQFFLAFGKRDPEFSPARILFIWRKNTLHFIARIARA